MKRNDQRVRQENAEKEWAQKESNDYLRKRSAYDRAYAACLEGRGYTVK